MNPTILQLNAEREILEAKLKDIIAAIKALQKVCEHDMQHENTTPYYRLYRCKKCGKPETE